MNIARFLIATLCLAAMAFGVVALDGSNSAQCANCCSSGAECADDNGVCCTPESLGAFDCSAQNRGYCRTVNTKCGQD